MAIRDLYQFGGNFTMTPHRSASTNITGYSYVSQDRLLATIIKVVGTFDGESISRYGFQWALDGNNWHDVVLYNGSWTNVMNITAEKNIKISALQGSVYLRSFITRKDYDTTYSPSILYRYNNVMRLSVTGLISNDFTSSARASEINVEDGYQYVLYDPATDEITGFDTQLGLISLDLRDTNTTELGRNAFKGCTNLETVYLPSTLQVIGENAFVDNESLTSIDTFNVSVIGDNAFKNCVAMESLVLGENTSEIGDQAFDQCPSLLDVTSYALEPPTLGTGNFTVSGDTLYVPMEAVDAYQNDPDWLAAFSVVRPLQEYIRIDVVAGDHGTASGSGWYQMGDTVVISATADTGYHFLQWNDSNTDNPRTITVGATDTTYTASFLVDVGTVGNTSYSSLTYTSVTCSALFSGLDTTGYGFCYSTTNSSPDLNDTVVTIGTGSINATASASLINLTEATKYYIRGYITNAGGTSYNTAIEVSTNAYTIVYNASSEITGTWVDNNTDTTRNTYDSVTGDGVLYLNAGVRAIGGGDSSALSPFNGNTDLASADLTNSNIQYFGSYAFYNCENLETVNLGSTATTIGNYAFYHCKELESIDLTGIRSIGNNAFNTCSSLVSLTIPSSITTIENNTFDNCTSLETLVLPSTLQRIGVASFGHCDSLISVTCYATSVPSLGTNNFTIMNDTLYVPYASVATYSADTTWVEAFYEIRPIGDYSYITVNNGGHGTTTGGGWYLNGTYAQISATPDSHYHFDEWSDGDTNAIRNILVTQDEVYSAIFAIDEHTITVSAGDHGSATGSGTYDYGTSVQIEATPDTDYHFTSWNDGNTDNPRTITVTGDATYTASFSIDQYTLTVTGDEHTTVTGSGTYDYGTSVQIEATPDTHYHFVAWSDGNTDNPRTITITGNITLSASSAIDEFTINVTGDANTDTTSGSGTYAYGSSVQISITPNANYHFDKWVDGDLNNPRTITVTDNASYKGTTAIDQYTLTVTGDEYTTVTGSGTYDYGTSVQITATPNTHYHFVAWSDGDTNATRTITVTSNITLSASSAIDTYTVTVTGDANTNTTSGSGTYGYGSSVTISATADSHYHFVSWSDGNTDNPRTITVTDNVTYTATTAIDQHVITTQGDSHIASVTGGGLYDYGTSVQIEATPDSHYHFVSWSDGNTDNPRTITVTEDATYRATSAIDTHTITVTSDAYGTASGSGTYDYGDTATISITPDTNYHFVSWNDGNTSNPRSVTVTGDETYSGTNAIDQFTLTVLSDDVNEGTVSGGGTYDYGTSVQISATAESGYEFVEWNDSNTDNPRTITVTANATYTAYFQSSVPLAQIRYNATSAVSGAWVTNNTDTTKNTWDSVSGDGVLYLNSGVTSIGGGTSTDYSPFWNNTALRSVDMSDSGITEITLRAFNECTNLVTAILPTGLVSIVDAAFRQCTSLTSVTIPDTVTTIGNSIWYNDTALTSVTIGSNVTSIGVATFYTCNKLTSITLPATLTSIGNEAFNHCDSLTSVTCYATSVPTLGTNNFTATGDVLYVPSASVSSYQADSAWVNAFTAIRPIGFNIINYNATSEVTGTWVTNNTETSMNTWDSVTGDGTLFLKPGVTTIGGGQSSDYSPFYFYRGLTSVVLPSQITTIDTYAFYYCLDATSITIPNTVTSIGEYAFFSCQALPSLTIPDSVTTIGIRAFENCYVLTSVTLPNTITSINTQLFATCRDLPSITIPASVTAIGNSAFTHCDSLLSVTCLATSVPTLGTSNFSISGDTLYVHPRSVSAYQASTAWVNAFTNIRPFANVILYNASSAASGDWITNNTDTTKNSWDSVSGDGILYLNNGVTTLGATSGSSDSPFYHNTGLTSLDLSYSSITAIGQNAINGCTSLTTVTMSPDITQLYYGAFANCSSLTTIDLSHITILSDYAFASCSSLASVDITSAGSIYEGCFEYCTALSSITFPTTCSSIAVNSFRDCSSLTEIELPSTITYIGADAFNGCTNLMKVTCNATSVPFLNQRNFTATGDALYVPSASVSAYQADSAWLNAFSVIVSIGAKFIRYNATSQATGAWVTNNTETSMNTWDSVTGDGILFLNSGVTTIGGGGSTDYSPFYQNSNLTSLDFSDSGLTTIGQQTCYQCGNLTSVTIPEGVTTLGQDAFYTCSSLTNVIIPNSVTTIGNYTFRNCSGLTSVTIGSGVTSIGNKAFSLEPNLLSVTCLATSVPTLGTENFTASNDTLYVPSTAVSTYQSNSSWNSVFTTITSI